MDDDQPGAQATLEEKLCWIDRHRPPPYKPPHSGSCDLQDVVMSSREKGGKPDPNGKWIRRSCRLCGRFHSYRRRA
jgi:hypothetical protein